MAKQVENRTESQAECTRPKNGPYSGYFPNLVVLAHDNRRALFYDDLLRGKTVLIHCMSTRDPDSGQAVSKLAEVQSHLGASLGREVFIYSLTIDPGFDTPAVLRKFAERYGAREGWLFLTGDPPTMSALHESLFRGVTHNHDSGDGYDCSAALIRYGNEAAGLWGSVAWMNEPEMIAQRIRWLRPLKDASAAPRRKGPPPL
jgi:protein SCO1/2